VSSALWPLYTSYRLTRADPRASLHTSEWRRICYLPNNQATIMISQSSTNSLVTILTEVSWFHNTRRVKLGRASVFNTVCMQWGVGPKGPDILIFITIIWYCGVTCVFKFNCP
jgi:hypothetical protein